MDNSEQTAAVAYWERDVEACLAYCLHTRTAHRRCPSIATSQAYRAARVDLDEARAQLASAKEGL